MKTLWLVQILPCPCCLACTSFLQVVGIDIGGMYIACSLVTGGGGGGGGDTIFLAESAIFYPYTLHGVFGKAICWSVLTSVR